MKCIGVLLVLLALTFPINAQSAKVIALSPEMAKEAKALYEQRDLINRRIEELRKNVENLYLMDEKPGPSPFVSSFIISGCGITISSNGRSACPPETAAEKKAREERVAKEKLQHHLERKPDWYSFEFSEDFKFIVPLQMKISTTSCSQWNSLVPANLGDGHFIAN